MLTNPASHPPATCPRLPGTLSHCHSVTMSHCHNVILSHCHNVILSHCHIVLLSHCHTVLRSHCHTVTPQLYKHSTLISYTHYYITITSFRVYFPLVLTAQKTAKLLKSNAASDILWLTKWYQMKGELYRNMKIRSLVACGYGSRSKLRAKETSDAWSLYHMILIQSCFGRHFMIVGSRLLPARCLMNTIGTGELQTFIPVVRAWNTNARLLSFVCSGVQLCSISQAFAFS